MPIILGSGGGGQVGGDATQNGICNLALRRLGANPIDDISDSTTEAEHCNVFWTYVLDEVLEDYPWNFTKKTRALGYTSGYGVHDDSDIKTITNITSADPAVVTAATHGFETDMTVYVYDVEGMTEVNERIYEIERVDASNFKLLTVDSTAFTAYSSGGKCVRKESISKYENGYTYDLPSDLMIGWHLDDENSEFEVMGLSTNLRLLTTVKDASLVYTSRETTPANLTNRFINAFAWRLAADLAVPLGKKGAKQIQAMEMYNYVLGRSKSADAKSSKQNLPDDDPWLTAGGFTV